MMLKSERSEQIADIHGQTAFRDYSVETAITPAVGDDVDVTQYLEAVSKSLAPMPAEKRAEIVRELGQHINALVDARIEIGEDRPTATRAAIAQFGDAKKLARRFQWAWIMPRQRTQRALLTEAARYLALGIALSLIGSAIIGCEVQLSFYNPERWRIPNYLWTPVWSVYFALIPAWLGRRAALRSLATGGLNLRAWAVLITQVVLAYSTLRIVDESLSYLKYRIPFSLDVIEVLKYNVLYMIPIGVLAAFVTRSRRLGSPRRAFGWTVAVFTGWTLIQCIDDFLILPNVGNGPADRLMAVAQFYFVAIFLIALFGSYRSRSAAGPRAAEVAA